MTLPEFLTRDAHGFIHLTSHRVGLEDLVHFYNEGYSAEMLLEAFPTLPLPAIHKVIAFYLEHKAEVDAYVDNSQAEMKRQREEASASPDLAELRRRMTQRSAVAR